MEHCVTTNGRRHIQSWPTLSARPSALISLGQAENDEALALYLAARLLLRHSDEHNPHVVKALEKLADALSAKSPRMAGHIVRAADAANNPLALCQQARRQPANLAEHAGHPAAGDHVRRCGRGAGRQDGRRCGGCAGR